jgi:hypothetical protein
MKQVAEKVMICCGYQLRQGKPVQKRSDQDNGNVLVGTGSPKQGV